MNDTCPHCGELRESDGYCPDGCELYVGSVEGVTSDTVARELGEWWK